jgi:hypothetical protein
MKFLVFSVLPFPARSLRRRSAAPTKSLAWCILSSSPIHPVEIVGIDFKDFMGIRGKRARDA